MKSFSILSGALCVITMTAAFAADDLGESHIHKAFSVAPGGHLSIKADRGSIEVHAGASDKVEVTVTRQPQRGAPKDILERHHVTFSQEGNDVNIVAEMPEKSRGFLGGNRNNNLKVHYVVSVPTKYNVNLNTSGGSITISDLEGEARAGSSGGGLKFGAINGPVHGRTSGGSITVHGATQNVDVSSSGGDIHIGDTGGNVQAHTSGGSVHIDGAKGSVIAGTSGGNIELRSTAGPVEAHTSGGSILATLSQQPAGPCTFKTSGGGIELKLAAQAAVDLEAGTSGGTVSTDFPITGENPAKKSHLRSKVNGGGPKVVLGTSGGSIRIHKI